MDNLLDKQEILRLLKEDQFIRDEVKRVIRQKVVAELEPLRREIVQPLTIDDIVLKLFPGAVCSVWKTSDEKGFVHGIPSEITIDVLEHQGEKYYCDCRNVCIPFSQPSTHIFKVATPEDILYVIRVGKLYRQQNPDTTLHCIMGVRGITPKASQMAEAANIDVVVARQK